MIVWMDLVTGAITGGLAAIALVLWALRVPKPPDGQVCLTVFPATSDESDTTCARCGMFIDKHRRRA